MKGGGSVHESKKRAGKDFKIFGLIKEKDRAAIYYDREYWWQAGSQAK